MKIWHVLSFVALVAFGVAQYRWRHDVVTPQWGTIWWDAVPQGGFSRDKDWITEPRLVLGLVPWLTLVLVTTKPSRQVLWVAIVMDSIALLAWCSFGRLLAGAGWVLVWPDSHSFVPVIKRCFTAPDEYISFSTVLDLYKTKSWRETLDLVALLLYLGLPLRMLASPVPRCRRIVAGLLVTGFMLGDWVSRMSQPGHAIPPPVQQPNFSVFPDFGDTTLGKLLRDSEASLSPVGLSPMRFDVSRVDLADFVLQITLFSFLLILLCYRDSACTATMKSAKDGARPADLLVKPEP